MLRMASVTNGVRHRHFGRAFDHRAAHHTEDHLTIFVGCARSAQELIESISVYTSISREPVDRFSEQLNPYGLRFRTE